MASPEPYTPHWQQCLGHARCQECGSFVEVTWRWFEKPATWTRCYCDACVETMLSTTPAK
jgi:hypothetical protein